MVDVLVLNYNDAETTISFVKSVENFCCVDKILVVDNCSTDSSFGKISDLQSEKILVVKSSRNGGYGAGNNLGIRYLAESCKSKYILLANPDVIVSEKTLQALECFLSKNRDYAVVAPFMLDTNGVKQYNTAFRIPSKWEYIFSLEILTSKYIKSFYYPEIEKISCGKMDVGAVSGSLFMMNVDDMLKYGMYDENIFLYCEEIVLGLKFQRAHKGIALLTNYNFIHNHSVSINKSFKTAIEKHKLLMQSKLYVIKRYFHAKGIVFLLAFLLSRVSLLEVRIWTFIRGCL